METAFPSNEPHSTEHVVVPGNFTNVERALEKLVPSIFFCWCSSGVLEYRATQAAVSTYGHARIQAEIMRILGHETGVLRHINVDQIRDGAMDDALVIVRFAGESAAWVLLGSQFDAQFGCPRA